MCDPTSAAVAFQAGGQLLGYQQERAQAKALSQHYASIANRNADLANRSALSQYEQLLNRQQQERAASAQGILQVTRESQQIAGQAIAATADQGGGVGQSFGLLLDDFKRQELEAVQTFQRNQQFVDQQTGASLEAVRGNLEASLLSNIPPPVQKPNFLNTLLSIGGSAATIKHQAGKTG